MNDDLREELRSEIEDFRTQTKRFLDKELNVKEFKGYSGGFGSYAQLHAAASYESGGHDKGQAEIHM